MQSCTRCFPCIAARCLRDGSLSEDVRAALEKLLADHGMTATVTATPSATLGSKRVNTMSYSITSPPVGIGDVQLAGVSGQFLPMVQGVIKNAAKAPFDTDNSAGNLERAVENYYEDQGYAAVKVEATQAGTPVSACRRHTGAVFTGGAGGQGVHGRHCEPSGRVARSVG